ncbi:hypothetical protein LTR84_002668 [Exophiala bonariae]|uniref:Uncharacterized protein n=1 Tax=Exophiala bonariae TaxID=1690606 RepID=A0AAV9N8I8_9EURO|nr:hypothetical protein LTR84_002668 [Exophiala bonariae]
MQGEQSYLWINKNQQSTSLSTSKGRESALVNGHAQRVSAKNRKYRSAKIVPSKFSRLAFRAMPGTDDETQNPTQKNKKVDKQLRLSISESPVDPFRVTTLNVDEHSGQLLTFHVAWWRSVAPDWRTWHEVDLKQPADAVMSQKCFKSPLYMLTTITFTSIQMQVLKLPGSRTDVTEALHLKTILALREALVKGTYSPMQFVEVLSYLCLTEVFKGDFTAARVHLSAVQHLLVLVGGISKVLNHISEMIVFTDYYLALSTLGHPILGHHANSDDAPPVSASDMASQYSDSLLRTDWVVKLPEEVLGTAVAQLLFCTQTLQQAWTNKGSIINGYWVRKKCVSILICLLGAWDIDSMPSQKSEFARVSIILWTAFVLATTLDTQGAKNYIPTFESATIKKYQSVGMTKVSVALLKWNKVLTHDYGVVPPGLDTLLAILSMIPNELEASGGVNLSELMSSFSTLEQRKRLEKALVYTRAQAERSLRFRVWCTSILLC